MLWQVSSISEVLLSNASFLSKNTAITEFLLRESCKVFMLGNTIHIRTYFFGKLWKSSGIGDESLNPRQSYIT